MDHTLAQVPVKDWPAVVVEIARVIGHEGALALWLTCRGRHCHFPKRPPPDGLLTRTVGPEAAAQLCKAFAAITLAFPTGSDLLRAQRNAAIRQARQAGAPLCELARIHRLSVRSLHNIVKAQTP
jgi:hypothetical protein